MAASGGCVPSGRGVVNKTGLAMGGFFARLRGEGQNRQQQPSRVNEQDKAVLVSWWVRLTDIISQIF